MMGTTPIYNLAYPDYSDMVDDGATAIGSLATDVEEMIDIYAGLKKIVPTGAHTNITFDSRGNGTPTIGATDFTIGGVFSSLYNSYRLIWTGYQSTGAVGQVWAQLRNTDISTSVYAQSLIYTSSSSTTVTGTNTTTTTFQYAGSCAASGIFSYNLTCLDIYNPAQAVQSMMSSMFLATFGGTNLISGQAYCYVNSSTVATGINLQMRTPVVTTISRAGTLSIYGYNL